jgi:hypothetical protein
MWSLLRVCPLSLFLASVCALAQPAADPRSVVIPKAQLPNTAPQLGTASEEEIREQTAHWHADCIRDWDRQTHMSKKEWADTCQRIVANRVKWLRGRGKQGELYVPPQASQAIGINH